MVTCIQEVQDLTALFMSELVSNYMYASGITVLIYDIVINLDEEIQYIWRSSWSSPKALFIFARYYPLCRLIITLGIFEDGNIGKKLCYAFQWYHGFGGLILIVPLLSLIFFLRVAALYGNNRRLVAFFAILFVVEFICDLITTVHVTIHSAATSTIVPSDIFPGKYDCDTSGSESQLQLIAWIPTAFNSTLLFFLTIAKLWSDSKDRGVHRRFLRSSPLYVTLVADGVLYFFITFVTNLVIAIADCMPFGSSSWGAFDECFQPWYTVIYSLSSSRLILNLRRIGQQENDTGNLTRSMQFATFAARAGDNSQ